MKVDFLLPYGIRKRLWGDRKKYGLKIDYSDPDWQEWQGHGAHFYLNTQQKGIGAYVNDQGYKISKKIDFEKKILLEIGPGALHHSKYWNSRPEKIILVDINQKMLNIAIEKMSNMCINTESLLITKDNKIPLQDESVDCVATYFSLEHANDLSNLLNEIDRVLRPDGVLFGAIPCEGGIAWGLGRYFTSRRWFKKYTNMDPDKIICWEHPNFANNISNQLNNKFAKERMTFWPFGKVMPSYHLNLVVTFVMRKLK